MIREYPDPNNPGKWKKMDKVANAYFHSRDLACLRCVPELSNINENHIYIEDGVYHSLTEPFGNTRPAWTFKRIEKN